MKGFPNQIAALPKIAAGIKCLCDVVDAGEDAKDDGTYGEALVRAGVAGTGHTPKPVETYLHEQRRKKSSDQSFRTTARGLRELFRLMGLIDDSGHDLLITQEGRKAASYSGGTWDDAQVEFWRGVIRNIEHADRDGTSHPYQVLLRLVARVPGISRAKCALALEATDDSTSELDRIVALAARDEADILARIGVSRSNWDNAKKVLPKFAEQLGDVIRSGRDGEYVLADAPGRAEESGPAAAAARRSSTSQRITRPRPPRSSREVTPDSIGAAGLGERSDEVQTPSTADPAAMARAIEIRADRLRRHNLLVRQFASEFSSVGATLYEDPFDILALFVEKGVLVEVKTLDGSASDERDRVRDALGQLLYYESFLAAAVIGQAAVCKIACFETKISAEHMSWLNGLDVATVWKQDGALVGDDLARDFLGEFLPNFA